MEGSVHVVGGASKSDGRTLDSAKNSSEIGVSGLEQVALTEKGQRFLVEKMRCTSRLDRDCDIEHNIYFKSYILQPFSFALSAPTRVGVLPRPRKLSLG